MVIVLIRDIRVHDKKSCKRCIVGLCLDRSSTLLTSTIVNKSRYLSAFFNIFLPVEENGGII